MKNKNLILFIVLLTGIVLAYFLPGKEVANQEPVNKKAVTGQQAPDFELKDIDGKVWRLSDLQGNMVRLMQGRKSAIPEADKV